MISTLRIFEELSQTMDVTTARKLAGIFDVFYEDLKQTVTKTEFNELKEIVRELASAQQRTEQRVKELAEAQQRTEGRISSLEVAVEKLAEAQRRTEQRVEELAEAQVRTETALRALIERVDAHEVRLAKLDGRSLESEFREKAASYLGMVLRGVRVISVGDLAEELEGVLTEEEWEDVLRADALVRGRALIGGQRQEVLALVEVSVTLDEGDVVRAARRAALLRKQGWKVLAVVAGEQAAEKVVEAAALHGVAVVRDGQRTNWTQALVAAGASAG